MSNSVLMRQPVFSLDVNIMGPALKIYMNDVTVYADGDEDYQLSTRLPVNHWMHPRDNSIGFRIYANEDGGLSSNYKVSASLVVHDYNNPDDEYIVATLSFDAKELEAKGIKATVVASTESSQLSSAKGFVEDKHGDVVVHEIDFKDQLDFAKDSALITLPITLPNSLPLWAFFESDEIPNYNAQRDDGSFVISEEEYEVARQDLKKEYQKIQDALAAKDISSILSMFDERNREIDQAFYRQPGTTAAGIKESMEEKINNPELILVELKGALETEDNHKLASLFRGGRTTAVTYNVKGGGSEGFPMMFRKQGGKWILTR